MKYDKNKTKKKKCHDCKKPFLAKMQRVPINTIEYHVEWEGQCKKCHIEFNRFMLGGLFKK